VTFFYIAFYRACCCRLLHDIALYKLTIDIDIDIDHFFLLFFSCTGGSGRTGEPGEGIVDVTVGRLTHGSTSQYLALCGGMQWRHYARSWQVLCPATE